MGWRYFSFRIVYELKRKSGLLKKAYPVNPKQKKFITLEEWKIQDIAFFFQDKFDCLIDEKRNDNLQTAFNEFQNNKLFYFNSLWLNKVDWLENPDSGYKYDISKHWTEVNDFSESAGDIKFVWERSRFSWVYTLIRYEHHYNHDCAEKIFSEIDNWIESNPINQGPNYKCSQEISLRILNWIFALYYYKNNPALTSNRFDRILHFIYWQLHHVYSNINFSRIAVRNNHAITETLMLYLGGLLFPFFPESTKWKKDGKRWFEEEIAYQIYEDGTFLQFSNNYHRVVIQLLTWAFHLAEVNGESFTSTTYQRAYRSLEFLYQCQSEINGQLPNYGANDGALFFKLNDCDYRDFRPQLNALHFFLTGNSLYEDETFKEDVDWYGSRSLDELYPPLIQKKTTSSYPQGGFYILRDKETLTFIRCGKHKDRPSHADNLHIDIWYKGKNVLRDAGTYKYNTTPQLSSYFNGTSAHNTVSLDDHDQMKKGPRFIWLNWSQSISAEVKESSDSLEFSGSIRAFDHLGKNIIHHRKVIKKKNSPMWEIHDKIEHQTDCRIIQHWHPKNNGVNVNISSFDSNQNELSPIKKSGYYSSYYGQKEESTYFDFITTEKNIKTKISLS